MLTFRDGRKMCFLGARIEFLRDLCVCLQERCGDSLRIVVGAHAASLFSIAGNPRRLPNTSLERTRDR